MTVTIHITGLEPVTEAIRDLAKILELPSSISISCENPQADVPTVQSAPEAPIQPPVPAVPAPQPIPTTPVPQIPAAPVPQIPAAPVQQTAPAPQPVPTSAKTYTTDELSRAAMGLMDAGRQNDLIGLLQQFGVRSLPDLPQEQYGAFATALRGLGAQI